MSADTGAAFHTMAQRAGGALMLNLGAGSTTVVGDGTASVDVDLIVPRKRPGPMFVVADAERLPFRDDAFDGVVAKDVLEHVVRLHQCLGEIRRVVHVGAKMCVLTPRAVPRAVWADPTHVRGFTAPSLRGVLESTGWRLASPLRRMGSIPGAGRLKLRTSTIESILRIPGLGHYFGFNFVALAEAEELVL